MTPTDHVTESSIGQCRTLPNKWRLRPSMNVYIRAPRSVRVGKPKATAICRIVAHTCCFEGAAPDAVGNRGKPFGSWPKLEASSRAQLRCASNTCHGHSRLSKASQAHPNDLEVPMPVVSFFEMGNINVAALGATCTQEIVRLEISISRSSHQAATTAMRHA